MSSWKRVKVGVSWAVLAILATIGVASACVSQFECAVFDPCTNFDCVAGECVYTPKTCSDGNLCTVDRCDPFIGCVFDPKCPQDGITCNGQEACVLIPGPFPGTFIPVCAAGIPLDCNDQTACTIDVCTEPAGCGNVPLNCDDGNLCTTDACSPVDGCASLPIPGCCRSAEDCDDGCTVGGTCTGNVCVGGMPLACDDANPCTTDACVTGTGCTHTAIAGCCPDDAACSDGEACTDDRCAGLAGCASDPKTGFAGVSCVCDRGAPTACGIDGIPKKMAKPAARACKLLGRAGRVDGRKQKRLVGRAATQLRRAGERAAAGRGVGPDCAAALAGLYADGQSRAEAFRDAP